MSKRVPKRGKPITIDRGGDELTRLQSKSYVPEEGLRLFLASHRPGAFARRLQDLKDECDAILAAHNLPPSGNEIVEHDSKGNWRFQSSEAPSSRRYSGWATASTFAAKWANPFTQEWYAARLGSLAVDVLSAIAAGKITQTTFYDLVQIGDLTRDRAWRFKYRKSIVSGVASSRGGKLGAEMRRRSSEAKTKAVLEVMRGALERPGRQRTMQEAAATAEKQVKGTTAAGNKRLWYRHNKKV